MIPHLKKKKKGLEGLGSSVCYASDFSSGHDLEPQVHEFKPCVRLCADSSEPGAWFGFCLSLSLSFSLSLSKINKHKKKKNRQGTWVAQSVERPTSAQVMASWLVSSSPMLGSVPTARSLEPALDSVSLSLSLSLCPSPSCTCLLSLSLSTINKH